MVTRENLFTALETLRSELKKINFHAIHSVKQYGDIICVRFTNYLADKNAEPISQLFDQHSQFQYDLDFSSCSVTDKLAINLLHFLLQNKIRIHALDLSYNQITDKSCEMLAKLIEQTEIKTLSCKTAGGYEITLDGGRRLEEALKSNTTLTELNLGGNAYAKCSSRYLEIIYKNKEIATNKTEDTKAKLKDLTDENELLKAKLEKTLTTSQQELEQTEINMNEVIKKFSETHKELYEENARMKQELDNLKKMAPVKKALGAAMVIKYNVGLFMQKKSEEAQKQIKECIQTYLNNGDYAAVGTLSNLLKEEKTKEALQWMETNRPVTKLN
jgi:hypothetical protein